MGHLLPSCSQTATCFFEEEVGILRTKRVNSDEMSDEEELREGGVLGELRGGGELRMDEVGTGCDALYAAFCARVRGAEATVGW